MTEAEWLHCTDAREMLHRFEFRTLSKRKLRLFAIACCRCSRQLLLNKELCDALEVSVRYADGRATDDELIAAHERSNGRAIDLSFRFETEREIRRWAETTAVARATAGIPSRSDSDMVEHAADAVWNIHRAAHRDPNRRLADLLREIIGNPFHDVPLDHSLRNPVVLGLAQAAYDDRSLPAGTLAPDRLAVLADALEDAGCDNADILDHLRSPGPHVRGCWPLDLLLGMQ